MSFDDVVREENSVPCSPCSECNGTGVLVLAPKPPPLPPGDEGRNCSGCKQRFPKWSYCGHSTHNLYGGPPDWWCSPQCYVAGTGDTRPWDGPHKPEMRVTFIGLFR